MTLTSQSDQLQLLPRVETWVIQLYLGRLQSPAAALPSCLWRAAALQDTAQSPVLHPPWVLGNDRAVNLLSQYITKSWAYMDTSSPFPAPTASLDTLLNCWEISRILFGGILLD